MSSAADRPAVAVEIEKSASDAIRNALMSQPLASATSDPATASPELRKAWDSYHAALEELRAALERTSMFKHPQARAKAYHVLMELQAQAYNSAIAPRLSSPRIHTNTGWQTDMYTIGIAGADIYYGLVFLDGTQTYRLFGRLGDIKLFLIQVVSQTFGTQGSQTLGNFNLADMQVGADGDFEVTLGGPKQAGNWIPLDDTSRYNFIMIRRMILGMGHDDIGSLRIEQISLAGDAHCDHDEFSEAAMAARLNRAEMVMRGYVKNIAIGIHDLIMATTGGRKNAMGLMPGETGVGGSPLCLYSWGIFSLEEDEALILELERNPDSLFWGFQLGDIWSRALPHQRWQTSLNSAQAKRDADGGFRFVISNRDPGIANWLDSCGRNEGQILFRNYIARDSVVPVTRKVKFDELMANLPADTALVTPERRKADLEYRREGYLKLYRE